VHASFEPPSGGFFRLSDSVYAGRHCRGKHEKEKAAILECTDGTSSVFLEML